VARSQGPEEFFEALRSAKREDQAKAAAAAPGPAPAEEAAAENAPSEPVASPLRAEPEQRSRSFPLSVFAEDEPTIAIRRSTLIFAVIVVAILLFISFRLGRGTAPRPETSRSPAVGRPERQDVRRPALPERLRGKSVICLKTFDLRQEASPANARAYRSFLNTSPEAAFIKSSGREAFIIAYQRELQVCVGPFKGLTTPTVNRILPKLRALRHNDVPQFAHADVRPVPYYAKVFN
jgi:hypothetical protein